MRFRGKQEDKKRTGARSYPSEKKKIVRLLLSSSTSMARSTSCSNTGPRWWLRTSETSATMKVTAIYTEKVSNSATLMAESIRP